MKATTVFAAVAAVVASVSVGLGAYAQNEPQARPAPAPATPPPAAAPAAPAPAPAATPAPASAATPAAADAKLTKEESDAAEAIILGKCTKCHGTEVIISQHLTKGEWQGVLDDMGPSAELTKAETALALRYLAENLGPTPKP